MKRLVIICIVTVMLLTLAGCGQSSTTESTPDQTAATQTAAEAAATADEAADKSEVSDTALKDGTYSAEFNTDSSMFHANEAYNGKGTLTVKDGKMAIHVSLPSKNTVNLFPGTAEQAQAEGAELLQPSIDTVTYSDGTSEEVHGFDIPVPYLDREFDCALIGTKGKWYDHKVSVSNPVPLIEDGKYTAEVSLSGGTGRASIESPAHITVENGKKTAKIVWSSTHYEYMTIDGVQYDRLDEEGNSTFEIPVELDKDIQVSALTTAMSEPHLIEYVLRLDGSTLTAE